MLRLSGLDASFAHLDTPSAPLAVAMACTFDQTTASEPYSFERIRATVGERVHLVPPMRRRLVDAPGGLGRLHWIEDPDFDVDDHLRVVRSPASDGDTALAEVAANVLTTSLRRDRPLWDMTIVEPAAPDCTASITRLHHAAIDGVSGAEALANFLDLEADADPPVSVDDREPETVPSPVALLAATVRSSAVNPITVARRLARLSAAGIRLVRHNIQSPGRRAPLPMSAPHTLFNGQLTDRRTVAFVKVAMSDLDTIRRPVQATINDVLLALCASSLRRYLHSRDDLPDRPLVAAVPVSLHGDDGTEAAANQVSGMLVSLPTDTDDPLERLQHSAAAARAAKAQHDALGPSVVSELTELAPPAMLRGVARLERSLGLSAQLPPLSNVVISNFAGPPIPLYFAGARLDAAYPLGPLAFGTGLNITAQSYLDTLHIGITACPDLVDNANDIAAGIADSAEELLAQSTAATASPLRRAYR